METNTIQTVDLTAHIPVDTADLEIMLPGGVDRSGWVITFTGPDHPQAIALANEMQRRAMAEARLLEQQRANGRKIKIEEQTPEEANRKGVEAVVGRILTWTPVKIGDQVYSFEKKVAVDLLMRPSMMWAFNQLVDFLTGERSFTRRSSTT